MSDIEFKDGAVCYGDGRQWFANTDYESDKLELVNNDGTRKYSLYGILNFPKDFRLNEILTSDFIPASEIDTEQKYNEVVEVFELFGFERVKDSLSYSRLSVGATHYLASNGYGIDSVSNGMAFKNYCKGRQLTYSQVIAIGKLKRMMLEREKSAPKTAADLAADNTDQVKNPKHYQLIEGVESIEIIARSMTKEQWKGFCLGNMLKYRIRAGKKDALQKDIEKANFYGELYEMHKEKCYD